jgi:NADH-quinone oxidoreductase subunit N
VAFPDALHEWRQIIVLISILSMGLGTIAALGQTNIKRLMAYSSISHMGYALLGLAAGTAVGVRGTLIYLAIYIVTNLGVFTCIQAMRRDGEQVENISDMKGMYHRNPKLAFAFSALFLSLSGMPPLAGFFAKIYVFMAALQAGLYTLAILGVLASVIGLAYYIRLVKVMFFDEPEKELDTGIGIASRGILTVSSIFILFFIVGASPIITAADAAAKALLP